MTRDTTNQAGTGDTAAPESPTENPMTSSDERPVVSASASVDGHVPQPDRTPDQINAAVVSAIKTVYDPEIPVDIYELGLIYEIDVRAGNTVYVQMTLTSPMCPVAETLPPEVEQKVRSVAGVADVELELVWEPPWDLSMMSEAAKLELNF